MICISCKNNHDEKFCPNCGEKNNVKQITLTSLIQGAFFTITNMDKGFLFNLKNLFFKPKKIIEEYILGKRKQIFNPISFLILIVTFYLVINSFFKIPVVSKSSFTNPNSIIYKISYAGGYFVKSYLKYFWILLIFPLGLVTKLFFRKFNYLEHITISSFVLAQSTFIGIFSYLIFRFPLIFDPFLYLSLLWLLYRVFKNEKNKIESFLMSFAALILFIILLFLIIILAGTIQAYLFN